MLRRFVVFGAAVTVPVVLVHTAPSVWVVISAAWTTP